MICHEQEQAQQDQGKRQIYVTMKKLHQQNYNIFKNKILMLISLMKYLTSLHRCFERH